MRNTTIYDHKTDQYSDNAFASLHALDNITFLTFCFFLKKHDPIFLFDLIFWVRVVYE